jgi:uncharacterized hydrophobic protein (TIGR00271 family)
MVIYAVVMTDVLAKELPKLIDAVYCMTTVDRATEVIPPGSDVIVHVSDSVLRSLIPLAHLHDWVLTIYKHKEAPHALRGLCLSQSADRPKPFADTRNVAMDVVLRDGLPVLNKVVIGRAFSFQPGGHSSNPWLRLKTVWHQLRNLKDYQPQGFRFKTPANEKEVESAAVGIMATTHVLTSNLSKQLLPDGLVNDSMFYSLMIAPKSLMEMLRFLFVEPFSRNVSQPGFIGLLRSAALTITGHHEFEYRHDELVLTAPSVELTCHKAYLNVRVAIDSPIVEMPDRQKEIRRIQNLPTAKESIQSLVSNPLPWITHAATEDFRELYQQLRENAQASTSFIMFMVLSTLLASFGLYANSAPVIIGAMILAPLMAPIVSLSMAFTRQDETLLLSSSKTLAKGFLVAIGCATLLSVWLPLQLETSEISARLRPTLLDLGIAIISGIAGAYANARSEAAKSLAGVAIAVALVPPLAVVGIGLGWMSFKVAGGALLLFVTNLAGIVFAASATFLLLGFAPFSRARKGIVLALLAVAVVSIPLGLSFNQLAKEASIVGQIEQVSNASLEIRSVQVLSIGKIVRIRLDVVGQGVLDDARVRALKQDIETELATETELEVNWITKY